jgi:subfamily B ATP-binding cassette protein HlyB/CyaB
MSTEAANKHLVDPGLWALVMLVRVHGVGASPEQILRRFGVGTIGIPEMLRAAKELGLKARSRLTNWDRLINTPLPAIAACAMAASCCWARSVRTKRWSSRTMMTRAEYEKIWDGRLVLMTRRAGLVELSRRFDITWSLGKHTPEQFMEPGEL